MINNYIDEKKITKPCLIDKNFLESIIEKKKTSNNLSRTNII